MANYYATPATTGIINIPASTALEVNTYLPRADGLLLGGRYKYSIYLSTNNNSSTTGDLKLYENIDEDALRAASGAAGSKIIEWPTSGTAFRTFIDKYCSPTGKNVYIKFVGYHTGSNIIYQNLETIYYSTPAIVLKCANMSPELSVNDITITKHWAGRTGTPSYLLNRSLTYVVAEVTKPDGNNYWTAKSVKITGLTLTDGSSSSDAFTGTGNKAVFTSAPFTRAATYTITFTITSNAGYTNTQTKTITVYQYIEPKLVIDSSYAPTGIATFTQNNEEYNTIRFKARIVRGCAQVELNNSITSSVRINTGIPATPYEDCTLPNNSITYDSTNKEHVINIDGPTTIDGQSFAGAVFNSNGTQRGLKKTESAKLSFTVSDSSGITTTLPYTLSILVTAFHLKAGGLGAKFGGAATTDNLLESDWKLKVNSDIEASGEIKGNVLRANTILYLPDVNDPTVTVTVNGVGNKAGTPSVAYGRHWHGAIDPDGYMPNYTVLQNDRKRFLRLTTSTESATGVEGRVQAYAITTGDLPIGANADVTEITRRSSSSIGTAAKGLCYADHGHKLFTTADVTSSTSNATAGAAIALKAYVDQETARCMAAIDAVVI